MKRVEEIVVIGAVGTAVNILYQIKDAILNHNYPAKIAGMIIDDRQPGSMIGEFKVIGTANDILHLLKKTGYKFIFSLYRMDKMKERADLLDSYNIPEERFASFFHPLAYISPDFISGHGNVILSNTTIQAGVKTGNFNIINSNVTIEHDSSIGDCNFISAHACIGAKVKIGKYCFVGLNSSVRENVKLEENVIVGMHSLVLTDLSNICIAGVPARILPEKKSEDTI